jgi:hypothetical protein
LSTGSLVSISRLASSCIAPGVARQGNIIQHTRGSSFAQVRLVTWLQVRLVMPASPMQSVSPARSTLYYSVDPAMQPMAVVGLPGEAPWLRQLRLILLRLQG